jgi:uncharacterized protein YkwD
MILSRRYALVLLAAGALSSCSSFGPSTVVPTGNTSPDALTTDAILSAINDARKTNGNHPPLRYDTQLESAARSQAQLMASKDEMSHNLGVTLRQRVTTAGYYGAVGENLAEGQRSLQQAIEGWLNSPGHRATLLSDKFVEFGLSVARVAPDRKSRYGIYWCFIAGGPFEAWIENG